MSKHKWFWLAAGVIVLAAFLYNRYELEDYSVSKVPTIAFIVGGPDPFWQRAANGARESAARYGSKLEVIVPKEGVTDQTSLLLTINSKKFDGVAISPLEPKKQAKSISVLASRTNVVTYDNDAPDSIRHCYVGTNNYQAGIRCGQLVKEALPDGGEIAIFVGDHDRENAQLRRQGLVDALKGENRKPGSNLDPIDQPINAGSYTIVATFLDGSIRKVARENVSRAIEEYPELDAMVALYGYNGPMCLEALEEANKLGEITIVAFDEHESTLAGIEAGYVYASVVQEPFRYGYEAVRILVDMSQNKHLIPFAGRGIFYLPCSTVKADNLVEFRTRLESQ